VSTVDQDGGEVEVPLAPPAGMTVSVEVGLTTEAHIERGTE